MPAGISDGYHLYTVFADKGFKGFQAGADGLSCVDYVVNEDWGIAVMNVTGKDVFIFDYRVLVSEFDFQPFATDVFTVVFAFTEGFVGIAFQAVKEGYMLFLRVFFGLLVQDMGFGHDGGGKPDGMGRGSVVARYWNEDGMGREYREEACADVIDEFGDFDFGVVAEVSDLFVGLGPMIWSWVSFIVL